MVTFLADPATLPTITIGKQEFSIILNKATQTDGGKPSYSCKVNSDKICYKHCALKLCTVDDTEAWVLIVRTNSGLLKNKFAHIDNQWQKVA